MGEIDRIDNIIYSLQEQVGINEQALFNINARIRQLDFQPKSGHSRLQGPGLIISKLGIYAPAL